MTTAIESSYGLDVTDVQTPRLAPSVASSLAFKLFLLLNGVMFLRPPELFPKLAGLPIYEMVILACTFASLPQLAAKLRPSSLSQNAITICVIAMLPAILLSLLSHANTLDAQDRGIDFAKTLLYYLLIIANVDSAVRLKHFLLAILVFTIALSGIALLAYHDLMHISTVSPYAEGQFTVDPDTGARTVVVRLQAMGVYGNPNGLARIVAVGIIVCLYGILASRRLLVRLLYIPPLVMLGHALHLTYSRGGLLGLMAAILVLLHARFGMRKGGIAILLLLPVLALFSGRQTDIDTSSGTGQLRIQLWSNGLVALRSSPLFGIGAGHYARTCGNDAHNSFIEAYVEDGLVGGSIFTTAFFISIYGLYRIRSAVIDVVDPELSRLRPFVLAIVVGTVVGQFSSSRAYFPPTYMILALATCYLSVADRYIPLSIMRMTPRSLVRYGFLGVGTLAFLHLYTKFNAHF